MTPFWTSQALPRAEAALLATLDTAHAASVERENPSSVAIRLASLGSGSFTQALCAGLLTTGGIHAPLIETYELLRGMDEDRFNQNLALGHRIPGWGNGFVKDGPDPIWAPVQAQLDRDFPDMAARIDTISGWLHAHGKMIHPNPSCYTAAVAIILGMPASAAPYLFIRGRLDAWASLAVQTIESTPKI